MAVHTAMLGDWLLSLSSKVINLLNKKVNILVYSGDKDFICNWRGGEKWTNELEWSKKADFKGKGYTKWDVNGATAGESKTVDNFTFLRVYDAGHMVPMD